MRTVTNDLMEVVDGAGFDFARHVLLCALKYMSENEVADMVRINELLETKEKEPEMKRRFAIVTETSTHRIEFDAPEHTDADELDDLARSAWERHVSDHPIDYMCEIEVEKEY